MGTLKAGKHGDLVDSMAQKIADAMDDEWLFRKSEPLGELGREDRIMLFSAIARGVLGYLEENQTLIETNDVNTGTGAHRHYLQFTVSDE